jgi:hypothetical protein
VFGLELRVQQGGQVLRGEYGAAIVHGADRVAQHQRRGVLEQEAAGTVPDRGGGPVVEVEGGQHDHADGLGPAGCPLWGEDLARRLDAVHLRHPDVHQDNVGPQLVDHSDRFHAVVGRADHAHAFLRVDDDPYPVQATSRARVGVSGGLGHVGYLDAQGVGNPAGGFVAGQCRSVVMGWSRRPCLMALVSISWKTR